MDYPKENILFMPVGPNKKRAVARRLPRAGAIPVAGKEMRLCESARRAGTPINTTLYNFFKFQRVIGWLLRYDIRERPY
jgi:hypothetical protein